MTRKVIMAIGFLFVASFVVAQINPNLEEGMKPYGSYQGGDVDSVSLTNGNVMLHIPLFSYPQRGGKLSVDYYLAVNSKAWSVQFYQPPNQAFYWQWTWIRQGASGVQVTSSLDYEFHRTRQVVNDSGVISRGPDVDDFLYGPGGAAHAPSNTSDPSMNHFESVDTGGLHFQLIPGSNSIEPGSDDTGIIIDRMGNQYALGALGFPTPTKVVNGPTTSTYADIFTVTSVTDSNGNVIYVPGKDTVGRTLPDVIFHPMKNYTGGGVTQGASAADTSGCVSPLPVSATTLSFPAFNGGTSTVKLCYSSFTLLTSFSQTTPSPLRQGTSSQPMLVTVVLPTQPSTAWTFNYDAYGNLLTVGLPTGGFISYQWQEITACSDAGVNTHVSRAVKFRTINDGTSSSTWTYLFNQPQPDGTVGTVVTDPTGNDTLHVITGFHSLDGTNCSWYETRTKSYQGAQSNGVVLRTVDTAYTDTPLNSGMNLVPTTIKTTLPNGKVSQVSKTYDSGIPSAVAGTPLLMGDVTDQKEYDFGVGSPGPLIRETAKTFTWQSGTITNSASYLSANLLDLPNSTVVKDGSGNRCAETDYTYDDPARLAASGITAQQQHGSAPGSVRGNPSTVARWLSSTPCQANASGTMITSSSDFFDTGMVSKTTDPVGNFTTFIYSSTFAGAYLTQTNLPDTSSPNLAHHVIGGNYDFNTGLLTRFTDQNLNSTTYSYDNMFRPTVVNFPPSSGGGQTTFNYVDNFSSGSSPYVERTSKIDGTRQTDTYVLFDGLGRAIRTRTANGEATPWDQVDTCYEPRGLVNFVSNPYQGTGFGMSKVCSGNGDSHVYDGLGRLTQVTHSDGSLISTSYAGAATSVTDEGNNSGSSRVQRVSQSDALGRLTSVCEVSAVALMGLSASPAGCGQDISGTGFLTNYVYDPLGNLTTVNQGALAPRSFSYDSLSRLLSATNPESGTITYSYVNAQGGLCSGDLSLCQRIDPRIVPNTTAHITTAYAYDALNRLRSKSYNDGATPVVTFNYDEGSALGVSTLLNTLGRKSSEYTTAQTGSVFSYDPLGRVINNSQCTPQNCTALTTFPLSYGYDVIGDLISGTDGAGHTLTYNYNQATRLTGVSTNLPPDSNHPSTLLSNAHFSQFGSLASASFGNTETETRTYLPRGFLQSIADTTPNPVAGVAPTGSVTVSGAEQSKFIPGTAATSGHGSVTIGGTEQRIQDPSVQCTNNRCTYIYDHGTISITVNGFTGSTTYGQTSTASGLASTLAGKFSTDTQVTASVSGSTVTFTATATGAATNYSLSSSSATGDVTDFGGPSFNTSNSGATLTGGANAVPSSTIYDSGTLWVTLGNSTSGNFTASAPYSQSQNSTPASMAAYLVTQFGTTSAPVANSPVNASLSGTTVNLTAKQLDSAYSLSGGSSTSQPGTFSQPSFTPSSSGTSLLNTVYSVGLGYAGDGNVLAGNDSVNGNWSYTYDDFNRLVSSNMNSGQQTFTYAYDRYGNRWQQNAPQGGPAPQFTFNSGNNRLDTYSYDAAGNLLSDTFHSYTYDGENRLTAVDGGATASYVYDAEGRRVRKTTGATSVDFLYDLGGQVITELSSSAAWNRGEVFAGGRHLATYKGGMTYFIHSDWLGTERYRMPMTGTAETYTSLPFGDALTPATGGSSPDHFTGKERDGESGLDEFGARYYSSALGRFVTADWSATPVSVPYAVLGNPQTLNLYSYARNNPISKADAGGHVALADDLVVIGGITVTVAVIAAEIYESQPQNQRNFNQAVNNAVDTIRSWFQNSDNNKTQSNPAPGTQTGTQAGTQPKDVYIDPDKYPASAGHAVDAQAAGQPDVLTIDRTGASGRRADAAAGHSTQPGTDRDEYPPAVTAEGGTGASVRNIPLSDNRGAGASVGQQIRDVPDGGQIRIKPEKKPH
jgi:RHS repeat-associated protein